jgi:SET domain-containing protein
MPKPYVHLLGPPLDVALDARIVGDHGRFARWGCKPNAALRPILCERGSKETDDESTLGFGVFATKDMKADEEIVLGWEWDDGNAVHLLPALLEALGTFP